MKEIENLNKLIKVVIENQNKFRGKSLNMEFLSNIYKNNKREIINLVKSSMIFVSIILLTTLFFPSSRVVILSFILVSIFTVLTVIYYTFLANEDDGKILINLWKIYFSTIFILVTILFGTFNYIVEKTIDMQKTKINYYLEIKKEENAKKYFEEYIKSNDVLFSVFSPVTIIDLVQEGLSQNNDGKENNHIFWYINFVLFLINLMTIVMLLICLVELSNFKNQEK